MPLANALSESSFIIYSFGVTIPWEMQRFSSRLYTRLFSFLSSGVEPVAIWINAE
jgi:hypothetical protein